MKAGMASQYTVVSRHKVRLNNFPGLPLTVEHIHEQQGFAHVY